MMDVPPPFIVGQEAIVSTTRITPNRTSPIRTGRRAIILSARSTLRAVVAIRRVRRPGVHRVGNRDERHQANNYIRTDRSKQLYEQVERQLFVRQHQVQL